MLPGLASALIAAGLAASKTFSLINNSASPGATVSGLNGLSGDLVLFLNMALDATALPTAVTPAGFTNVLNVFGGSGPYMRCMVSYRKLTASLSSITGMVVGSSHYVGLALVLRPNFVIGTTTVFNPVGNVAGSAPTGNTLLAASQTGAVILLGGELGNTSNPAPAGTLVSTGIATASPTSRFSGSYLIESADALANKTYTPDDTGTLSGALSLGIACT